MIRTCDTPEIRDARPGERATDESRESRPRVAVEQHLSRVAVEQYLSGPVIGWAAPGCWPPAPHTGATCRHCTAVQCSVQLYSCHTSNIITSSDSQSVSNSGSSQTLVTKCREILSPGFTCEELIFDWDPYCCREWHWWRILFVDILTVTIIMTL